MFKKRGNKNFLNLSVVCGNGSGGRGEGGGFPLTFFLFFLEEKILEMLFCI